MFDPDALQVGDILGRYVIVRPLGRGAAGRVYEAHDLQLDRPVALKLLHDGGTDDCALLIEARGLARVAHPNVVSLYELAQCGDRRFVAMERVQGRTLTAWLAERPRRYEEIRDVLVQAADGLAAVHEAGLAHRDFKPANVLVGDDGRVRVVDFGLARAEARTVSRHAPTTVADQERTISDIAGTPAYLPPEAFDGRGSGVEADRWAFAVVAFEALTGRHPFPAHHPAQYLARIHTGRLDWGGRSGVPVELRRHLRRWLDVRPSARPGTLGQMRRQLLDAQRPRRRFGAVTGLAAVLVSPWLAMAAVNSTPGAMAPRPSTCVFDSRPSA